jgi:hypothetical protein
VALPAVLLLPSCNSSSPTEPPGPTPACSFQVTTSSDALPPEGGQRTLTISTQASCSWTVRPSSEWITVTANPTGTGSATAVVTVGPNAATTVREGTVTVETQTVRITQRGRTVACTYDVSTGSQRFGPEGGSGRASIATGAECPWTAIATDTWLTLDRSSGTGSAEVTFTVAPFTGASERSATITVNDRTITIRQDPVRGECTFFVEPTAFEHHWHGGQEVEVRLTTSAGCRWTVASQAAWLTFSGPAEGEGSAVVRLSTSTFTQDATRRAALEFRWNTPTVGQNVWVDQGGCRYGMDQTPRTYGPAGDPDEPLTVVMQPVSPSCAQPCPWTATSDVAWIHILSSMPRAGDDMFRYSVDANATGATRQGRIRVADRVLLITQTP